MPEIRTERLTKKFNDVVAVDDLTFSFPEGKVTCLLGPSGCGKTTLLRMIAGLEMPTSGSVHFGDMDLTGLAPRKRNIGMVFQYPVVYRGISVYKNIELPLLRRKISASDRRHRIEEALELLNLQDQADIDSSQLDNVSRQKVSVARAISYHPDIILFDEPMTNIDANSRVQFSHFFKELSKKLNQVIVYVTHDQTEAMTLADQIALMEDGRIVQCDEPRALYNQPEDIFGGWFL
ncbi:MAG: ABC transporter ATP-binding protein, partial [Desulfobacterales bacterium]